MVHRGRINGSAKFPWQFAVNRSSMARRNSRPGAKQASQLPEAHFFSPAPYVGTDTAVFGVTGFVWRSSGPMHVPPPPARFSFSALPQPPPPPPRRAPRQPVFPPCKPISKQALQLGRKPLQSKHLMHQQQQQQQLPPSVAPKKKQRRGSGQKRRRAALQRQSAKKICQSPQSSMSLVCPAAPYNNNAFFMERFEQQCAAQEAQQAAADKLAEDAAAQTPAVITPTASEELPVCPPAPYLDNEFYMSRFEQQLARPQPAVSASSTATAAQAALSQPSVVQAGVAEWDPLLQEVTRFMDSTTLSHPATAALADDACSQC